MTAARARTIAVYLFSGVAAGLLIGGCGGGGGALHATPARIDLGEVPFGGEPSIVSVTVENRSDAAELIRSFRIDGDTPAQIAPQASSCATGKRLAARATCTVVVTLQADRFGPIKGRLIVTYGDAGSPLTVAVVATGGGEPELQVVTRRLDFGPHGAGSGPATAPVTLSSRGTAAAGLDGYRIAGRDAGSFSIDASHADCSLGRIAPGTACHLPIVFHSSSHGRRRAVLVLTTKVLDSSGDWRARTFRVPLSGGS